MRSVPRFFKLTTMTMLYSAHCAKSRSDCSEYTSRNAVAGGISEKVIEGQIFVCTYYALTNMYKTWIWQWHLQQIWRLIRKKKNLGKLLREIFRTLALDRFVGILHVVHQKDLAPEITEVSKSKPPQFPRFQELCNSWVQKCYDEVVWKPQTGSMEGALRLAEQNLVHVQYCWWKISGVHHLEYINIIYYIYIGTHMTQIVEGSNPLHPWALGEADSTYLKIPNGWNLTMNHFERLVCH